MKKTFFLMTLLGTAMAANAQTNVTIYGVVDIGINYDNGTSAAGKTLALKSGQQSGSRLGLKGTEDLGSGMSASFVLENGFNADDGSLANGGRLFGRQAWVGLNGNFGSVKLGRQYSATYNALNAIDPFGLNQAGDAQRVYGYALGKVDPISRSDNTVAYTSPGFNGVMLSAGYKFGETAGSFNTGSSKFAGAAYVKGPLNLQLSYQSTDGVALVAATTALGALSTSAGLGSTTVNVKNLFAGGMCDFGMAKLHAGIGDTRLEATGSAKIVNYLLGLSAALGSGTAHGSWNRNNVRQLSAGASNQYGLGYSYPLSKRTNFYTSASYTRNDSSVRLNAASNGASDREFQAGIRHMF